MKTKSIISVAVSLFSLTSFAGPMSEGYLGRISNLHGSYTSLIIKRNAAGTPQYIYFTEQQASGVTADRCIDNDSRYYCPGLSIHTGASPTQVSRATLVLDTWSVIRQEKLTRNGVAYSARDKRYYAVGYVNYGSPQTGYFFRSLTNSPTGGWESMGTVSAKRANYSGVNLIINDEFTGLAINHTKPTLNKFVHYTAVGNFLKLFYSANGTQWFTYKQNNVEVNLRPTRYNSDSTWGFPSVVKTPHGYFMSVMVGWNPTTVHRLMYSRDGLNWNTQIGTEPGGSNTRKNFSLSYDAVTDTVYSMATESGTSHKKLLYKFIARQKAPR